MINYKPAFSFDLVSDLYIDYWEKPIEWSGLGTSLLAVVAGDVSADLDRVVFELKKIGKAYRQVLFIDGDLEHETGISKIYDNRKYLANKLKKTNITYLFEQVVTVNNIAFVGANLWWVTDETKRSIGESRWLEEIKRAELHTKDLEYLRLTVSRLQTVNSINRIVLVSHTVPNMELLDDIFQSQKLAVDASDYVEKEDDEKKISHWCFGHWGHAIDVATENCRYLSNPLGRPEDFSESAYFPRRVELT